MMQCFGLHWVSVWLSQQKPPNATCFHSQKWTCMTSEPLSERDYIISSPVLTQIKYRDLWSTLRYSPSSSRSSIIRALVVFLTQKEMMSLNSKAILLGQKLFTWLKLCHHSAPAGFISSEDIQGHAVEARFRSWNIPAHIWGSSRRWKRWQTFRVALFLQVSKFVF